MKSFHAPNLPRLSSIKVVPVVRFTPELGASVVQLIPWVTMIWYYHLTSIQLILLGLKNKNIGVFETTKHLGPNIKGLA